MPTDPTRLNWQDLAETQSLSNGCPDCEVLEDGLWRTGHCDDCGGSGRDENDEACSNCLGTGNPVCCRCEGTGIDLNPD